MAEAAVVGFNPEGATAVRMNVGPLDQTLRVGLGFGLVFAAFLLTPPASTIAYVAALGITISGFSGRCPLYSILGINTCGEA